MLNIAKNIYTGWDTANQKHTLPEAEVIPIGDAVNEKKKITTTTKKYPVLKEHENIPLPGFTMFKVGRKNWGSTDQSWLIIDPRGFLVRITNKNLEDILMVTGITEGLIQEECVWAREDSQVKMVLVPVSSPLYVEAVNNTEMLDDRVDIKNVQIGDKVILQNKLIGEYMGTLSLYGPIQEYVNSNNHKPQAFLRRQIVKIGPGKYHYQIDAKILKVLERTSNPRTREEVAEELNLEIKTFAPYYTSGTSFFIHSYPMVTGMISHVSTNAVTSVPLSYEPISKDEAIELFDIARPARDFGMLMLEKSNGQRYLVDFEFAHSTISIPDSIHNFKAIEINNSADRQPFVTLKSERRYYSNNSSMARFNIDNFAKFYKIVKHVKNQSYV